MIPVRKVIRQPPTIPKVRKRIPFHAQGVVRFWRSTQNSVTDAALTGLFPDVGTAIKRIAFLSKDIKVLCDF